MTDFDEFVRSLRMQWLQTKPDNGLTFQEFLLALFIFHTQENN